jgi:hypothetical protein
VKYIDAHVELSNSLSLQSMVESICENIFPQRNTAIMIAPYPLHWAPEYVFKYPSLLWFHRPHLLHHRYADKGKHTARIQYYMKQGKSMKSSQSSCATLNRTHSVKCFGFKNIPSAVVKRKNTKINMDVTLHRILAVLPLCVTINGPVLSSFFLHACAKVCLIFLCN